MAASAPATDGLAEAAWLSWRFLLPIQPIGASPIREAGHMRLQTQIAVVVHLTFSAAINQLVGMAGTISRSDLNP